jgi:hypothetical protein
MAGGILGLLLCGAAQAAQPKSTATKLLREGTMLINVDGTIGRVDSNDLWYFELEGDINEPALKIAAGTRFPLLPSATLENLTVDANDRRDPLYRLTAQVTQYREANFLFPSYFLPLSKLRDAKEPPARVPTVKPSEPNAPPVGRTSDTEMTIPDEIAQRLQSRRPPRALQRPVSEARAAGRKPRRPASRVLVDAVGFVEVRQGQAVFVPDAFGRNVSGYVCQLLPNQVLEQTERQVATWPEPTRLMVAGLETEYRGKKYLLLQRVIRAYSHGNFGG